MKSNGFNAVLRRYAGVHADISRQRGVIAQLDEQGRHTLAARKVLQGLEGDLSRLQQTVWGFPLKAGTPVDAS